MIPFLKNFAKRALGPPLLFIYRNAKAAVVHADRRSIYGRFGHCEPDLDLSYPWDIRGPEHIYIGRDVFIGPGVLMSADVHAEIHIGDKVMFGPSVKVIASDHRYDDPSRAIKDSGYGALAPVMIGDDVWIGAAAIILKGVSVGTGSIVGAGSVVTSNIGTYEIWAGNPARKIKDRFSSEKPPANGRDPVHC